MTKAKIRIENLTVRLRSPLDIPDFEDDLDDEINDYDDLSEITGDPRLRHHDREEAA